MKLFSILIAVMDKQIYTCELNVHTRLETSTGKTGEIWVRSVDCVNVKILVRCYTIVLQNFTTVGPWVKNTMGYLGIIPYNCRLVYNYLNKIFNLKNYWKKENLHLRHKSSIYFQWYCNFLPVLFIKHFIFTT